MRVVTNSIARVWKTLVYLTLDVWVALVATIVLVTALSLVAGLLITVVGAAVALAATFVTLWQFDRAERWRTNALLDTDIVAPLRRTGSHRFGVFGRIVTDRVHWKSLAYWALKCVTGPVGFAVTIATWCASFALIALPAYIRWLPEDRAELGFTEIHVGSDELLAHLTGIALLCAAPFVTLGFGRLAAGMARNLLGGNRVAELEAQLDVATTRTTAAVDAAEAERRRIERDLHDGAQQRLVAVAMTLGMAKEKFDHDPDAARALIDEAHRESKAAMTELRNIARGIHPAVLTDRGLDAALSGLVARSPIPVALTVSLGDQRLPEAIEGGVYYVVAEALTNIAKHAEATSASANLIRRSDRIIVEVADNGRGGAAIKPGGGLAGLSDRVTSLGGFLHLSSPVSGPTNLLVELPCAS
jgi:signal transduction histidine kinase